MKKNVKFIGGLSKKSKINIFIAIFLIFILISVLTSINQISRIIRKREQIIELEQQLNWERQKNIEYLAAEKSLYEEEAIEYEARKQFNMTVGEETNFFVETDEKEEISSEKDQGYQVNNLNPEEGNAYTGSDLWEKLSIFYNKEIKSD